MTAELQQPGGGTGLPVDFIEGQTDPSVIVRDKNGGTVVSAAPQDDTAGTIYFQVGPAHAAFQMSSTQPSSGGTRQANGAWISETDDRLEWAEAYFSSAVNEDGTNRFAAVGVDSSLLGPAAFLRISPDTPTEGAKAFVRAVPGQTGPVIDVRRANGDVGFAVSADGDPVLVASDGSQWRLVVADDGSLSTVAA